MSELPFTTSTKRIKYLAIQLRGDAKDHIKYCKPLFKEIRVDTDGKTFHAHV